MALARWLAARGIEPVWSGGRGEEAIVAACDPQRAFRSYAGRLDLVQVRALVEGAALLVAPDTGVAHLGRVAFTPNVTLYGPGSAVLAGTGSFWRDTPSRAITIEEFPCRDQRLLFGRELDWVRRCRRTPAQCAEPRCMHAISVERVVSEVNALISRGV
jgi:ADP-heptose:LPS heptosyltransferase